MRKGIEVEIAADDRARLEAIVADRNSRQKHVERARIVLLTAKTVGTLSIMRQVGCAKATVWRWQERFMTDGVAGLPQRVGVAWAARVRGRGGRGAAAGHPPAAGPDAAGPGGG